MRQKMALLCLISILLTGVGITLLSGNSWKTLAATTLFFAPLSLSYVTCYVTSKAQLRFGALMRYFSAGAAYFSVFALLALLLRFKGSVITTSLLSIGLSSVPYLIWRPFPDQPNQEAQ